MDEIKIEDNVPYKDERRGSSTHSKFPFKDLKVGQSFFVKDFPAPKMNGSISYWQRILGIKLSYRKVDGGIRVWRLK